MNLKSFLFVPLVVVLATTTNADDAAPPSAAAAGSTNAAAAAKLPIGVIPDPTHKPVLTTNTVVIRGEKITYVAETGMLPLLKLDGSSRASLFYVAYTRVGETNISTRPVTFCFNGGPGSSSVWLHLGALGPRRVHMNLDGTLPKPPFSIEDNDYSILPATDMVFIDPVATGFSRISKEESADAFFGQSSDVESIGEFIRLWTTRHTRWRSPKYLCGESYGTFRASALAEHLRSRYGFYLNGLIFVSGVLDFSAISAGTGNDLPYVFSMPNFTATAHFHKKLPPDLQGDLDKALSESRALARGEYLAALLKGDSLVKTERENLAAKLARVTGLSTKFILDNDLRVDGGKFRKELLRSEGLILGAYDARITGRDNDPAGPYPDFDPSYAATYGPFSSAINSYVREDLKFEDDLPYEIIASVQPWKYDARNSFPEVVTKLGSVASQNPYMRVMVLAGRSDLVCPIDGIRYSIDHAGIDPLYRTNISYVEFDAGHMMYVNRPDLQKMQAALQNFIKP